MEGTIAISWNVPYQVLVT
jgi:hypothetical protein